MIVIIGGGVTGLSTAFWLARENHPVTVVEKRMQSRDHPVLLGVPETYYLKSLILRKLA